MKLSIIIPVYNVEAYVGKTLESVFQTDASPEDYEVIVVNDGTKDGSMEVVRRYADRQNLIILEQMNQGISAARNAGLDRAKGDYVWFVDSDDWLVEDGVGKVLKSLEGHDEDVLVFPLLFDFGDGLKAPSLDYKRLEECVIPGEEALKNDYFPLPWSQRYIIRRALLMPNYWLRFPVGYYHQDAYFNIVLLYFARRVRVMCDPAYVYRSVRNGSSMNTPRVERSWDKINLYRRLMLFRYKVVDPENHAWFRRRCFHYVPFGYYTQLFGTPSFNRFVRLNGLYIWREWLEIYPHASIKEKIGRFFFFRAPAFHSAIKRLFPRLVGKRIPQELA